VTILTIAFSAQESGRATVSLGEEETMLRHQQSRINALPVAVKAPPEEEVRSVGDGLDDLKVGLKFLFTHQERKNYESQRQ
jgi:hypothetical protein